MKLENFKLKDLCEVFDDGNWIESKDQSSDGIRLIQTGNIKIGVFANRENKSRYISEITFKKLKCREIFAGDILVSRLPDPVGRSCIIPKLAKRAITSVDCTIIRLNKNCLPEYLNYVMQSSQYFADIKKKVSGATRQRISKKNLGEILISLPPLTEQKAIISKLNTVSIEIDKLEKFTSLKIKNIKSYYESILHKYFTDNKYKKIKIKDVCAATQGVQISKNNHLKVLKKGYLRYLYISDFSNNKNIKYVKNEFPKKVVKLSDIIVVNTGASAGNIFRGIEGILSNNLFKVQPDKTLIEPEFLYYFVTSNLFKNFQKKIMRGTANPHMGHENFLSAYLNLPPLNKQKEIVSKIFELNKNIKNLNQNYLNKINSLKGLKSKLLYFKPNNIKAT